LREIQFAGLCRSALGEARDLVVRAQPAHVACRFLLGPLGVERHQPFENFLVGEIVRPAIGLKNETVEPFVQFL
jgi:hypothetical protein